MIPRGTKKAGVLRLFSDEALTAFAFQPGAHRCGVRLGEAAYAQAVNGVAVYLRFVHPDCGAVEFGAVLAVQLCTVLLVSASDLGAASRTDHPPEVVAAVASTAGAIAPVVSVASATCPAFVFFAAFSGFRGAVLRFARRVRGRPSGAVVSVLPTTTRADDLGGESLVGSSILGVEGCADASRLVVSLARARRALRPACSAASTTGAATGLVSLAG